MNAEVATLTADIRAYEERKAELEAAHKGEWVIFYNGKYVNLYSDFDSAAKYAVEKFGRGPYLIRQIGAPPIVLPASVMYRVG